MDPIKLLVIGDTKPPIREKNDAGIDIFIPNLTEEYVEKLVKANPGQPVKWGVVGSPTEQKEAAESEDEEARINKGLYIYIPPHEDILIPTCLKARIPEGQFLKIENRSSVSVRQKLQVSAGVLDPSFSGEIMVHIFNFSSSMKFLSFGQKIAQMIPYVYNAEDHINNYIETIEKFKEYKNLTTEEKFYEGFESHRPDNGQAGFGSSGS